MSIKIKNPPSAYILMNSMRNIGYTFTSAVADIVDNSISAKARNIDIFVPADPSNIYLCFVDDGIGMDSNSLRIAMRYGSKGKNEQRDDDDLGRYGLGLKSASLSQCRRLTVISKANGVYSGACWDLNEIEKSEEWTLIELDQEEIQSVPCFQELASKDRGTLVVWQDFDVLRQTCNGLEYKGLVDSINETSDILGLIFHRFIANHGIVLKINGTAIEPIDPFLEKHHKTEIGKTSDITVTDKDGIDRHISVTPYLLPYLKDLSETDIHALGGAARINSMQGFYVYRNERLIIYGTWFRMTYRNELAKYARIKVDVPTSLDDIWKIDIKKQSAELPPAIRKQLQKCVESVQLSSRRKNQHRLTLKEDDTTTIWQKNTDREHKAIYTINRDAPLIQTVFQQSESTAERQRLSLLLSAIEKSIPFHDMYTDEANNNIATEISDEDKRELTLQGVVLIKMIKTINNCSEEEALVKIIGMEPFSRYEWSESLIRKELKHEKSN